MTKVKICGLTRPEDIEYVNACRPDYVGFVFARSRRQVSTSQARKLRDMLAEEIMVTGVFVNEPAEHILELCENKIVDVIQLHGDEDEAYIRCLRRGLTNPIVKAQRVRTSQEVLDAQQLSCDYLLLDTYTPDMYGGSGETFDLDLVPGLTKPFFLAGGLTIENVQERIRRVHPYAVDISSGVEGADGYKDQDKIRRFIEKVREE